MDWVPVTLPSLGTSDSSIFIPGTRWREPPRYPYDRNVPACLRRCASPVRGTSSRCIAQSLIEPAATLHEVRAGMGRLDLVPDHARHRLLDHLARVVRHLGGPVPGQAESVRDGRLP